MFGTVARLRVKSGHLEALKSMQRQWDETRNPKTIGAIAAYVFNSDRDASECTIVAIFRDRASYVANAEDPAQDAWYQELRSHLESDPEWVDGEVIAATTYECMLPRVTSGAACD